MNAPTPAPTIDIDRVLDALDRCAAAQSAALRAGDDDRLLAVLTEKQRVLEAVDLPGLLKAAPPARAAGLRARVKALIDADAAAIAAATVRRDAANAEMSALAAAGSARAAYQTAEAAAGPRRLDVSG